ncbi:MAG: hypothetical protein CL433_02920 [Acidimicrobiaceae bacterium]|jgi:plastocyanin|nr:hypothetical protein [Acidimicrobiaceae bacterium]HAB58450.1 hypothetical protein [Acidimicrobiaceae bacterium]
MALLLHDSRATLVSDRKPATVLAMRLRPIIFLAALVMSSCAEDDSLDAFIEVEPEVVIETEELDVDIDALEGAAADTESEVDEPAPIEIPDDALDLSGVDQVALDIQDNAFTQRVVVVSAGTEITWTNQGRNEHNVRPAVEGAFEPISTLDLAEKGDSASLVFETPGDFPYFCSLHGTETNGQTGRVIVVP